MFHDLDRKRATTLGWIAGTALLALAVYWPGLAGGFLFDDFPNLVNDPDWQVTGWDAAQWQRALGSGIAGAFGRGFAMLTFAVNHLLTGMDPWAMKLTNVLLHLLNGALVFGLTRQAAAFWKPGPDSRFASWAITAAWLVHPLQVSSVLYVVQRMELGAAFGILLALVAYMRGRRAMMNRRSATAWFGLAVAATLLGLGFKETALLAPVFAGLLELLLLRFRTAHGRVSKRLAWSYGLGAAVALAIFLAVILPKYADPAAYAGRDYSLGQRLLTQPSVLAHYLVQMVAPAPSRFPFYYDGWPVARSLLEPRTLVSCLVLALLAFGAFLARTRRPCFALGIGWFFVGHALTSNVVPLELAFEHRNYLPLLGIAWSVADLGAWATASWPRPRRLAIAGATPVALSALCLLQAWTWGDPARLTFELARRAPDSPRANYRVGELLLGAARGDPGSPLWPQARLSFERAAAAPRSGILGDQALIYMDAIAGRPVPPTRWDNLRQKLTRRGLAAEDVGALYALVACRTQQRCALDDDELAATLDAALAANPRAAVLHSIRGTFLFNVRHASEPAIRALRRAVALDPATPAYQAGLAKLLLASDLLGTAEADRIEARLHAINRDGGLDQELAEIAELRRARTRGVPTDTGDE